MHGKIVLNYNLYLNISNLKFSRFPFRYRKNINIASGVFNFKNKTAVFLVTNPGFLAFLACAQTKLNSG